MKLIRFQDAAGQTRWGQVLDATKACLIQGDPFGPHKVTDETADVARLLAPVEPVNVIAIGANYRRHAEESGVPIPTEPLVFAKLSTAVIGPGEPIRLPAEAPDEVDYEAELAIVIGKEARKVSEADALDYVLGYTCANDVSARDCQIRRDQQWMRAKSFDTFCPLGPWIVTGDEVDPSNLRIQSRLDGKVMQDSNTSDMIFPVPVLISFLSRQFTLRPGTVILTGTPSGVGFALKPPVFLRAGSEITIDIESVGQLTNPVQADA